MNEQSFTEKNKKKIEHLKKEIIRTFSQTKQPDKNNIALHECEECRGLMKDFANVRWQNIKSELLEKSYDKLPLFSSQAFNYFLPSFLTYTLNNFDDEFSNVCEFTLYAVTPDKNWKDKDGKISDYWIEKFSSFTDQQMKVIFNF